MFFLKKKLLVLSPPLLLVDQSICPSRLTVLLLTASYCLRKKFCRRWLNYTFPRCLSWIFRSRKNSCTLKLESFCASWCSLQLIQICLLYIHTFIYTYILLYIHTYIFILFSTSVLMLWWALLANFVWCETISSQIRQVFASEFHCVFPWSFIMNTN